MSKFRRISCNIYENEKKRFKRMSEDFNPTFLNTDELMEKMGIEFKNNNLLNKQTTSNINLKKHKCSIINEDDENKREAHCRSQQKRNKYDRHEYNHTNRKGCSSVDKRIMKKEKNKKSENRSEINITKKEKEYKTKKAKDNNETKDNDDIFRKKQTKGKIILEKEETDMTDYKKNNNKNIKNKGNKGNDDARKIKIIKKIKNNSPDKYNKEIDNRINIEEERKSKKIKENIANQKDEEKEKEKKKKKKKHKARSVEKDIGNDKILKFKEKLDSVKKIKNNSDDEENRDESNNSESNESENSSCDSKNNNAKKDKKNKSNTQISDGKNIVRSNVKHFTEIIKPDNEIIIKNLKDVADVTKENLQKIKKSRHSIDIRKNNLIEKKYVKRRSMNSENIRDKLEHLMIEQILKQNGGNTLFLTNYEKGRVIKKEFEFIIKNQKIKRKIRIGSCTKPGCSGPGIVKTNQDAYFIKEDFLNNYIFLGVCDGHGIKGEMISNYVTKKLPIYTTDINNESISNSFKKINSEIYSNKNMESDMAGTTVVSLIITADKIICPNLGDSRAVLFKFENNLYFCKNLSRDHKPSEPEENRRIINNNGRIKKIFDEEIKKYVGPDRVWLKNKEEPGLAMTRSIGDKIAHSIGVTDEPEIKSFEYDGSEKFAIIASDGIWEYMSGEDCLKVIKPFYEGDGDVEEASYSLVKEAFRKWKRKESIIDDITVILIFFEE